MAAIANPGRRINKLLFGCGNYFWPNSRESVGVRFVDHAHERLGLRWQRMHSGKADVALANDLAFVKPLTYLTSDNWRSLSSIMELFELPPQRVLIVYPEMRLPPGQVITYTPGSQSTSERAPFLEQFVTAAPDASFGYVGFGVGSPQLRTSLLLTASYRTDDARLERAFLANRIPREFDDALVASFDETIHLLRDTGDSATAPNQVAAAL